MLRLWKEMLQGSTSTSVLSRMVFVVLAYAAWLTFDTELERRLSLIS